MAILNFSTNPKWPSSPHQTNHQRGGKNPGTQVVSCQWAFPAWKAAQILEGQKI